MRSYHLPAHVRRGGFGLLCILSLALAAPVHAAQDSADAHYPATTEELVKMITSQRNFQANAQMISTSDAITQTIINIR